MNRIPTIFPLVTQRSATPRRVRSTNNANAASNEMLLDADINEMVSDANSEVCHSVPDHLYALQCVQSDVKGQNEDNF